MAAQERARLVMGAKFLSALLPVLCGFLAVVLSNLPVSLFGSAVPPPLLGFIPVYFWCLVRPDLMTPAATFAIGIVQDVMSGGPPGIWTLSFVVAYAVIQRQREAFAGLAGVAAVVGFAAAMLVVSTVAYLINAVLYHVPPLGPVVAELAITVLFYIPGAYLVSAIHHRLVGPLRSDF
ncbi:MAG TPA: rod shape-determining protein MreD [Rhizomicrobium sp.]|nr:rod shape-determining protein MreD [Rhizomicrobium sp.]